MKLEKETSERSERRNPIMPMLEKNNYYLVNFEGFTIKDKKVTSVLDKYLVKNIDISKCNEKDILTSIIGVEGSHTWNEKIEISKFLNVPFFIVLYSYPITKIYVYKLSEDKKLRLELIINSIKEFADWIFTFRDMVMSSPYEESDLPNFDKELRKIRKPLPGNLDCVLCKESRGIIAVIEFQTTIRKSVKNHCNNDFFLPTMYRKGDEQRWLVMDIISRQLKKPLIILVWSPNKYDNDIKIKKVDHISYSWDKTKEKPGLYYSVKEIIKLDEVPGAIEKVI